MHEGGTYLYDVEVRDEAGTLYERWEGLLLRAVERNRQKAPWGLALLAPYVERRLGELVPSARLSVAIDRNVDAGVERRERSDLLLKEMLGAATIVHRRSDGKPEVLTVPVVEEMNGSGKKNGKGKRANGKSNGMNGNAYGIIGNGTINISVAHAGELTLAVAGEGTVGCDLEPVLSRSASLWSDLLGEERFRLAGAVAQAATEDADTAATRIWAAVECLKKTGLMLTAPLVLDTSDSDGWVMLKSGPLAIGTYVEKGRDEALVLAVALDAGVPLD
jgi:enediyne polyketide synthase